MIFEALSHEVNLFLHFVIPLRNTCIHWIDDVTDLRHRGLGRVRIQKMQSTLREIIINNNIICSLFILDKVQWIYIYLLKTDNSAN